MESRNDHNHPEDRLSDAKITALEDLDRTFIHLITNPVFSDTQNAYGGSYGETVDRLFGKVLKDGGDEATA